MKSLKSAGCCTEDGEGESLASVGKNCSFLKKGPCFSKQMLCLMDVNLNYTCLYSPSCDDCTVAINLSVWTMFLFTHLLFRACALCWLVNVVFVCCMSSAELHWCNGEKRAAELSQSEEKCSLSQSFLCVEKICVCLCARAGVCVKRDESTAGLLRLG